LRGRPPNAPFRFAAKRFDLVRALPPRLPSVTAAWFFGAGGRMPDSM
jgi:hypothetical protein